MTNGGPLFLAFGSPDHGGISLRLVPERSYIGAMAVSLSIKSVPEELVDALRSRAARNHRSIQGELLHILEAAVRPRPFRAEALRRQLHALGIATPGESVMMVREDRDESGE